MCKGLKIFLCIVLAAIRLSAQNCDTAGFSGAYWFNGTPSSPVSNILPTTGGNALLFGNMQIDYNQPLSRYVPYITHVNVRGTPTQTQLLNYNGNIYLNNASQNQQGQYFVAGFTNVQGGNTDPWVAKLDTGGNPIWSFGLGITTGEFFKVAPTLDGGCVVVGRLARTSEADPDGNVVRPYNHGIALRLDSTGKVLWGNEFYTSQETEQVFGAAQMSDGSVIVTGVKDNGPGEPPGSSFFVIKMDNYTGQTIWQKKTHTYFGQITETDDGNLLFRQSNFLYFVNAASGEAANATSFTLPAAYNASYDLEYVGSFADKQDLYYDFVNNQQVLLLKMQNYSTIAWVRTLPGSNSYGDMQSPFSVAIASQNGTGGIYLGGGLMSQGLATHDTSQYEENSFVYGTSLNGLSPCTDTLNIAVSFAPTSPPEMDNFTWYGSNNLTFNNPRPLTGGTGLPLYGIGCYQNTCCRDTTVDTTVTMCAGGVYTLPNGATVNSTGFYSAILHRASGCDSIVFVTVTASPPAPPSLGDDTCFITPTPILLKANASNAASYLWQDGSTDSIYSATQPGSYWVQTTNVCGTFSDSLTIYPQCSLPVFMPSAFTPNGDGKNDIFRILDMKGQKLLDFSIYNRWGSRVFRTENAALGWDGTVSGQKPATQTFVYLVHYLDLNGNAHYLKGTVVLIR